MLILCLCRSEVLESCVNEVFFLLSCLFKDWRAYLSSWHCSHVPPCFLSLQGVVNAAPLAFILPPLCVMRLQNEPFLKLKNLPYLLTAGFGLFSAMIGTVLIIYDLAIGVTCIHGKEPRYCLATGPSNSSHPSNFTSHLFKPLWAGVSGRPITSIVKRYIWQSTGDEMSKQRRFPKDVEENPLVIFRDSQPESATDFWFLVVLNSTNVVVQNCGRIRIVIAWIFPIERKCERMCVIWGDYMWLSVE